MKIELTALHALALEAGISYQWVDAFGVMQDVHPATLRLILHALHWPAADEQACVCSLKALRAEKTEPAQLPPLLTAWINEAIAIPAAVAMHSGSNRLPYRLELEGGSVVEGWLPIHSIGREPKSPEDFVSPVGFVLPAVAQCGYHRLTIDNQWHTKVAVAPRQCFGVADVLKQQSFPAKTRLWGLSAQIYSLRSPLDHGLPHFTALEDCARAAAAQGAMALAISPVHAMFSANPSQFSPYSPCSRLFLNVLYIDPARVLGNAALQEVLLSMPQLESEIAPLEAGNRIDWPQAAALRLAILHNLFVRFQNNRLQHSGLWQSFTHFCLQGSQALQDHARFEAIDAHLRVLAKTHPDNPEQWLLSDWRQWPQALQDPRSPAVAEFALHHAASVEFHLFLQWLADAGRREAQATARTAGMAIGLIADLAIGADPGGSQAWAQQSAMLQGLSVGAPPDRLNLQGQGWGLGAFSPKALVAQGFVPWLEMLRATLKDSGGIRIDHVLGLVRLWLIPDGQPASEGAYLRYPFDDLLRLICLESHRHQALVIGEDMGTVPQGFTEILAESGVLGIRSLWFQRTNDQPLAPFIPAAAWPSYAVATTGTHDLPTVAGWWQGRDIQWRARLHLLGANDSVETLLQQRWADRRLLEHALHQNGSVENEFTEIIPSEFETPPLAAVLAFVGSTPAPLILIPLEDVLGVVDQPNLPGTVAIHPNWCQRLPMEAADALKTPSAVQCLANLRQARSMAAAQG